jgi:hypothetical protein
MCDDNGFDVGAVEAKLLNPCNDDFSRLVGIIQGIDQYQAFAGVNSPCRDPCTADEVDSIESRVWLDPAGLTGTRRKKLIDLFCDASILEEMAKVRRGKFIGFLEVS